MAELSKELTQASSAVSSAQSAYSNLAAGEYTVGDELKKRALQAYKDNQDIIGPLDKATADYYTAPQVAREKYQDIFNPFSREKLVSQYTANQGIPMLSYGGMYGQRMGRFDDLIGAGTRAYQAQTASSLGNYQSAQQQYENAMSEYQLGEDRRRYEEGKGGGGPSILDIIAALKGTQGGQPTGGEDPEFEEEGSSGGIFGIAGDYMDKYSSPMHAIFNKPKNPGNWSHDLSGTAEGLLMQLGIIK